MCVYDFYFVFGVFDGDECILCVYCEFGDGFVFEYLRFVDDFLRGDVLFYYLIFVV